VVLRQQLFPAMTDTEKHENRGRKWKRPGCIVRAFYAFLILYLINAAIVLIPATINAAKWRSHHIESYEIMVKNSPSLFQYSSTRLAVSDGQVIETEYCHNDYDNGELKCTSDYPVPAGIEPEVRNRIEGLFASIRNCAWAFPLYICHGIEYDSEYGYPKSGIWSFTLHAHGSYSMEVLSFEPLEWPINESSAEGRPRRSS
jgi:hypothetical protein